MIDIHELIIQDDGQSSSAGDCSNRTGTVMGYFAASGNLTQANLLVDAVATNLEIQPNIYVRYPFWPSYDIPSGFSRDQGSALMLGLGLAGQLSKVDGYYSILVKNWMRHPSGDIIGLQEISNLIRLFDKWYLYPILWSLDLGLVYNAIFMPITQPWDGQNLILPTLWYSNNKYWTPLAWIAKKILNKSTAITQVTNNLNNPTNGPALMCTEAFTANVWFLNNL